MRAAIYARISSDDEGEAKGVARQEKGARELAARHGWVVDEDAVLIENDLSASEFATKIRPLFAELVVRIRRREVDVVLAYSQERLTRDPGEWSMLQGLCVSSDVRIALENRGGLIDLTSATGKLTAGLFALLGQYESAVISERVRKAFEQRRAAGLPAPGGVYRPYGYQRDGLTTVPEEAEAIRQAAELILQGVKPTSIAAMWNQAALPSVSGKPWAHQVIRRILTSPRIAGLVAHKGEVVGPGQQQAILDPQTWEAVRQALAPRQERPAGWSNRKHLLTGFIICGVCGSKLAPASGRYRCQLAAGGCGRISRNKASVDELVSLAVVARLEQGTEAQLTVDEPEAAALTAKIAKAEEEIAAIRSMWDTGDLDVVDAAPMMTALRKKIAGWRRELGVAAQAAAQSLDDPIDGWRNGTLEEQTTVLRSLVRQVVVRPSGRGGNRFKPDSVAIVWA